MIHSVLELKIPVGCFILSVFVICFIRFILLTSIDSLIMRSSDSPARTSSLSLALLVRAKEGLSKEWG